MNEEIAKILRRDFGPYGYDALDAYIKFRINQVHDAMETADPEELHKLQGAVQELRKFFKLKEYVAAVIDKR